MKGESVTGSVALFVTHTVSAWAERICSLQRESIEGGERNRKTEGGMGGILQGLQRRSKKSKGRHRRGVLKRTGVPAAPSPPLAHPAEELSGNKELIGTAVSHTL